MLEGYSPVVQSLLGTGLTWGLTAAGSALVFIFRGGGKEQQRQILDTSLGFAAGVMLAASYWSLLAPAIDIAEQSGLYGSFTFLPVTFGFIVGALFVFMADLMLPLLPCLSVVHRRENMKGVQSGDWTVAMQKLETTPPVVSKRKKMDSMSDAEEGEFAEEDQSLVSTARPVKTERSQGSLRLRGPRDSSSSEMMTGGPGGSEVFTKSPANWRRILLLIIAITVHNIPEGLAVGVGFGAIGTSPSATIQSARNLALGIGIQNFPEGLAVSLPLKAAGMDMWKSFWYGQLSGMVEPVAGLFGAAAVVLAQPLLPYALAFAAGAMVFVVVDDIIPESCSCGNGRLSSFGVIFGFTVMMSLDVGLG